MIKAVFIDRDGTLGGGEEVTLSLKLNELFITETEIM